MLTDHQRSWLDAARNCARASDLPGVLRCLENVSESDAPPDDDQLVDDLRLFLTTALRMLATEAPDYIGTPWWDGAVAICGCDEADLHETAAAALLALEAEGHTPEAVDER